MFKWREKNQAGIDVLFRKEFSQISVSKVKSLKKTEIINSWEGQSFDKKIGSLMFLASSLNTQEALSYFKYRIRGDY